MNGHETDLPSDPDICSECGEPASVKIADELLCSSCALSRLQDEVAAQES